MQLSMFAFVAFGMLLAFVQCVDEKPMAEYVIKQNLSGGRSYSIKGKTNAKLDFSVKYDPAHIGKKLLFLENGKERFTADHEVSHIMSTWKIKDATGKELGKLENKLKPIGSKIDGTGSFGTFKIEGKFLNRDYTITKDGQKVARISMPSGHIRDTYDLAVYGDADQAQLVFFTVIVDEIVQH